MRKAPFLAIFLLVSGLLAGCSVKELAVNTGEYAREDCTVKVEVPKSYRNAKVTENGREVASQVINEDGSYWLYFTLDGSTAAGNTRYFELSRGKATKNAPMNVVDDGDNIVLRSGEKPILSYRYTVNQSPEGVSKIFNRSGYIHPACTPEGFVITNIQPDDHRHHYGIWNPWTKVEYKGNVYDLWNLGDSLGTVKAKSVDALYEGAVVSGFKASLDHVAFTPEGAAVIMNENWIVKATDTGNGYLWDFESVLRPCTDAPVTIKAYRYQGFSCRANAFWNRDNSSMMTSEGLERPQIDQSRARWIYVNGASDKPTGKAGFMFMSTPENYNSPEPLRIWDQNANGRGDVYVNFCPAKTQDWNLEPGKEYHLRYRVLVYDGEMTPERAEKLWRDFVYPPTITIN